MDHVQILLEKNDSVARLNFLRDLAVGLYEEEPHITKWGDLPKGEKKVYKEEAEACSSIYVLTLAEIKAIGELVSEGLQARRKKN